MSWLEAELTAHSFPMLQPTPCDSSSLTFELSPLTSLDDVRLFQTNFDFRLESILVGDDRADLTLLDVSCCAASSLVPNASSSSSPLSLFVAPASSSSSPASLSSPSISFISSSTNCINRTLEVIRVSGSAILHWSLGSASSSSACSLWILDCAITTSSSFSAVAIVSSSSVDPIVDCNHEASCSLTTLIVSPTFVVLAAIRACRLFLETMFTDLASPSYTSMAVCIVDCKSSENTSFGGTLGTCTESQGISVKLRLDECDASSFLFFRSTLGTTYTAASVNPTESNATIANIP
mmetsp:Transcript_6917/g.15206  ORF Transcript_6917/g.15206 Transcript_6917/m.15206 type:complete len:294 (+) Transcript_6917:220-1101(+)